MTSRMETQMRQLTFILALTSLFSAQVAMSTASCPSDRALHDARFAVHPSTNFDQLARDVISRFVAARDDFVYDAAGPIRSRYGLHTTETLILFSYDDVTTPQATQYGDVVFVLAHDANEHSTSGDLRKVSGSAPASASLDKRLVEVRWWADGIRQVVYDDDRVSCATHSVPMAENALY